MATTRKANTGSESSQGEYVVLARRYRPQQFADLVGQEPVARALLNALAGNRVAHAYLFTGARGVGKTSTARILAKALNCAKGPTGTPCDVCEICQGITSGEDVDVIEIDGASNRGIDEVRELRRNVALRPNRARYKIYIIDEVHMLTKDAFNALLKTLEEPPPHVKFIFATTEVQKIPVTILSRCQRFDFAGIGAARIVDRLRQVVAGEKMKTDDEALEWIARRAGGSMRDAQSLLDQLLAFCEGGQLTLEQVHRLLGTANDDRVVALAGAVVEHDAAKVLALFGQAADEGLQLGELLDQLIDYWRDLMIVSCAGAEGRELSVSSRHRATLVKHAATLGLDTILAGLDVLATTKTRLRSSGHARILIEMALVRLVRLENLIAVAQLVQELRSGRPADAGRPAEPRATPPSAGPTPAATPAPRPAATAPPAAPAPPEKKKPAPDTEVTPLTEASLPQVWLLVLAQVGTMHASELGKAVASVAGSNTLVLTFPVPHHKQMEFCQEPARVTRVTEVLRKITGRPCQLRFEHESAGAVAAATPVVDADTLQSRYHAQRTEALRVPLLKRASEQLGAQVVSVDDGFGAAPSEAPERAPTPDAEEA